MKLFYNLSIGLIFLVGCSDVKKNQPISSEIQDLEEKEFVADVDSEGETYSDSTIELLIAQSMAKEIMPLDITEILNQINCLNLTNAFPYTYSMDTLNKYKDKLELVSKQLQISIGVTGCFAKIKSNKYYDANVYYNSNVEPHSSESLELFMSSNESSSINRLTLAQEYGNELGDYVISSEFQSNTSFKRIYNHNVNYIHGIGSVDTMYMQIEYYTISDLGDLILLKTEYRSSEIKNKLFEN
jgi:hypothetical protein